MSSTPSGSDYRAAILASNVHSTRLTQALEDFTASTHAAPRRACCHDISRARLCIDHLTFGLLSRPSRSQYPVLAIANPRSKPEGHYESGPPVQNALLLLLDSHGEGKAQGMEERAQLRSDAVHGACDDAEHGGDKPHETTLVSQDAELWKVPWRPSQANLTVASRD